MALLRRKALLTVGRMVVDSKANDPQEEAPDHVEVGVLHQVVDFHRRAHKVDARKTKQHGDMAKAKMIDARGYPGTR